MGIKPAHFPGPALLALVLLHLAFSACERPPNAQMELSLGAVCIVSLYEGGNSRLYSRVFARIREIDLSMTTFANEYQDAVGEWIDPDSSAASVASGVMAINRLAGIEPARVRPDLLDVLERALHFAELSGGAFDPTVGPLVQLWGIGTAGQRIPADDEIAAALELVGWRDLVIDREAGTAFLRREGMALDLGAIARGYAADEAARIAREGRVRRGVIDLGGNFAVLGWREQHQTESQPWRIGIQHPLEGQDSYIGILSVHDTGIATSGVQDRYFESGGRRYHHILSTANGFPVDNGLLSVTVLAARSMDADALSTAVFALGFESGRVLIDSIPGAEAIFVFDDNSIAITGGLDEIFALISGEFVFRL